MLRITLIVLALLLIGCSAVETSTPGAPTDQPRPTETEPPPEPIAALPPTPIPFNLATPAIVIEHIADAVPPTLIPPDSVLPDAALAIYRPGPGSHVTSPFQIVGRGGPSFDERVHMRLLGEDGRVIAQQTTVLFAYPGNAGNFSTRMEFNTPAVAESARLEVSTDGIRWARMDQLISVDLVLLTEGSSRIHPVSHGPQKLAILSPKDGRVVEGGLLTVRGAGWTDSESPLQLEVVTRNGQILTREEIQLNTDQPGVLGSFEVEIPYTIPYSQYVRIAISEPNTNPAGLRYYSSIEVWLKP